MSKTPDSVERITAKGIAAHIVSLHQQVEKGLLDKQDVREHLEAVVKHESDTCKQYVTEEINKRLARG
ncbi:hypothetical protein [Streptomyces olivaceoviridis]|uniref:hypothetical protein n=1 Tax=Streptomyces olivaceoviridis TaxID=1921 RepID=UPI0036FA4220